MGSKPDSVCSVLFRLFRTFSLFSLPAYHGSFRSYPLQFRTAFLICFRRSSPYDSGPALQAADTYWRLWSNKPGLAKASAGPGRFGYAHRTRATGMGGVLAIEIQYRAWCVVKRVGVLNLTDVIDIRR
jgi:hypothetical protein